MPSAENLRRFGRTGSGARAGRGLTPPPAVAALAAALESHDRARIRLASEQPDLVVWGPRLATSTLQFDRYGPNAWTLDTTRGPHAIPLAEVTRVQVRSSAWQKGAIVGFLLGAAAIEAVNAAGKYQIDRGETVFIGGLFGTGGAVAGALVAAPFHTWHTVYPPPWRR